MGYCLYGNDIDDTTSPIEAGLSWITKFTKDFVNAEAIKKQKRSQYKSMGMKVTKNRLDLFQLRYKLPLVFFIEDLKDKMGDASGTKITIQIPVFSMNHDN